MKVTFRAEFAGPKGALNPAGFKFSAAAAPTSIEIFDYAGKWYAGVAPATKATAYKLEAQPTHGCARDMVAACFERQVSAWRMFDPATNQYIDPDSVVENPQGKFAKKVLTHIARADQNGMPGNYFKTECGETVHAHQIRSKRGETPPDCPGCKTAWEQHRKEARIA